MPDGDYADLGFPVNGVNVRTAYDQQPPDTTPAGANVRGFEPGTQRMRGGSRSGHSKFVAATVNGAFKVQDLNLIATTDVDALGDSGDDAGGSIETFEDDPSSNNDAGGLGDRVPSGRRVRQGGSGIGLNRNRAGSTAAGIRFIQSNFLTFSSTLGTVREDDVPFTSDVVLGDFLLVASANSNFNDPSVDVTDNQGNLYTRVTIAGIAETTPQLTLWYARASLSGPCTVQVTCNTSDTPVIGSQIAVLAYRGVKATGQLQDHNSDQGSFLNTSGVHTLEPGAVTTIDGCLVVGVWFGGLAGTNTTTLPDPPIDPDLPTYSTRLLGVSGTSGRLYVLDAVPVKSTVVMGGPTTPSLIVDSHAGPLGYSWAAISASFKKA